MAGGDEGVLGSVPARTARDIKVLSSVLVETIDDAGALGGLPASHPWWSVRAGWFACSPW